MIHGDGVMGKYSVIVAGRQAELYAGIPYCERATKSDQLLEFLDEVRQCNRDEFEVWYDLYKDMK
jgi:hypothetical protein